MNGVYGVVCVCVSGCSQYKIDLRVMSKHINICSLVELMRRLYSKMEIEGYSLLSSA